MDLKYVLHHLAGLLLAYAYDDLSYKKIASQLHTFSGTIYDAGNAVDRNTTTCMRTIDIGPSSPYLTVWWKVDLGGIYNIHSIAILFRNYDGWERRQRGRFAGFSLYVSNTDVSTTSDIKHSILCYKDGPELPFLDFTTTCSERGRYVIFYNERLVGVDYPVNYVPAVVFTELCEVVVQGCKMIGVYGTNCDNVCPTNCKDSICHIEKGTCLWCESGWTGLYCNITCKVGWFDNCSQQCIGHCRYNSNCNNVTGRCDKGCAAGWTGTFCDEVCIDGTFGFDCVNNCSGYCLNDSPCNKQTGHCDFGCYPGYTDDDYSRECTQFYGENCQHPCSAHCINQTCDRLKQEDRHGSLRDVEGQTETSCTLWIVAFSISIVTNIMFITVTVISLRKQFWKQTPKTDIVNFSQRSGSNAEQTATTVELSHYQELRVSQNENIYQTLHQQ